MTDTPGTPTEDTEACDHNHHTIVDFQVTNNIPNDSVELSWRGNPSQIAHTLAVGVVGYTREIGIDWAAFLHTVAMTVDAIDQAASPDVTVPDPDWFNQPTTEQE